MKKQSADARKYKLTVRQREVLEVLAENECAVLTNSYSGWRVQTQYPFPVHDKTAESLINRSLVRWLTVGPTEYIISDAGREALNES